MHFSDTNAVALDLARFNARGKYGDATATSLPRCCHVPNLARYNARGECDYVTAASLPRR